MWRRLEFCGVANQIPRTRRLEFGRGREKEIDCHADKLGWDRERKPGARLN